MRLLFSVVGALTMLCTPVWAVNKCIDADGKVTYQAQGCSGKGEKINVQPTSGLAFPNTSTNTPAAVLPVPADMISAQTAAQNSLPRKSLLEQEADTCLAWYKPLLRDPAGAYHSQPSKESRVLTLTVHATNGYGGYTTKSAACEFFNGRLDADWTKIHADRRGW